MKGSFELIYWGFLKGIVGVKGYRLRVICGLTGSIRVLYRFDRGSIRIYAIHWLGFRASTV